MGLILLQLINIVIFILVSTGSFCGGLIFRIRIIANDLPTIFPLPTIIDQRPALCVNHRVVSQQSYLRYLGSSLSVVCNASGSTEHDRGPASRKMLLVNEAHRRQERSVGGIEENGLSFIRVFMFM